MANTNPCLNYAEYYSNATVGRVIPPALLQTRFDVGPDGGGAANAAPADMATFIGSHIDYKIIVVSVTADNTIYTLHRYATFRDDIATTAFNGRSFAIMGDLLPGGIASVVSPPANWLNRARNNTDIAVPTVAAVDTALAAAPDQPQFLFAPRNAGDADTETIRVRNSTPVPAAYAHLVVSSNPALIRYRIIVL